ncbi:hypothetical protein N0V82_003883 [Gnomoniopsis sp. IMI 355080]|nr:hypothetical protein N0V82_003883 [Gnomoniopsis sp. IMI 355080]
MDYEVQFPLSLSTKMNDDESLATLRAWGAHGDEETLGGALKVHAPYDKQRAKFNYNALSTNTFRTIPGLINRVEETLGRFAKDEDSELYGCATSLYSAIVDCLPSLINHLLRQSDQSKIRQYGIMAKSVVVDEVAIVEEILQPLTQARIALEKRASRLAEQRVDKMATQVAGISTQVNVARRNQHQQHYETTTALSTIDYTTGRFLQEGRRIGTKVDAIEDAVTGFVSDQFARTIRLHEENAALREKLARLEILNSFHMITEEKRRNQLFYTECEHPLPLDSLILV